MTEIKTTVEIYLEYDLFKRRNNLRLENRQNKKWVSCDDAKKYDDTLLSMLGDYRLQKIKLCDIDMFIEQHKAELEGDNDNRQ